MSIVPSLDRQAIGAFIREQRKRSTPDGFPDLPRRRRHVAHLTQSDLAELAAVSDAVVAQVENGRYKNLNTAMVVRLAVALRMQPQQEQYLLNYLQPQNGNIEPPSEDLPASVRSLVDTAQSNPAMVITPRFDIVYWNSASTRMLVDFAMLPPEQRNVIVNMFCVPEMRELWSNWESNSRNLVGGLRMQASLHPTYRDDIVRLATRLGELDPQFREWWHSEVPTLTPNREKDFHHPEFGTLRIFQTVGAILGSPHLSFLLFTPRDKETENVFRQMHAPDSESGD